MNNLEKYNVTNPQRSILNTEKYYLNNPITNVSGVVTINQKINFNKLQEAINLTIKNNDALRLRIKTENGVDLQYFKTFHTIKVKLFNVSSKKELDTIMEKLTKTPINYDSPSLFKFIMFRYPNKTGGAGIIVNHLLSDAWSTMLIASDVLINYDNLINNNNRQTNLYSYKDFIIKESEYEKSIQNIKDKKFWEDEFSTFPEEIVTITNNNNTNVINKDDTKACRKEFIINKKETEKINGYCKKNKISPYVFFISLLYIYISKINNQEDIIIGTPILNRKNVKEKNTIGMFVNSLPLRIKVDQSLNIKEFMHNIVIKSMKAFKHQSYSIFEILKYVREKYSYNNSIYDCVFSYQNAQKRETPNKIKYKSKWYFNGNISETINIHVSDVDINKTFNVYYDYKESKLSNDEINNIHKRLRKIASQIIKSNNKELIIKDINILNANDINSIKKINNTGDLKKLNYVKTVTTRFDRVALKNKKNIALIYKNKKITYIDFYKEVIFVSSKLLKIKKSLYDNSNNKNKINNNTPIALMLDKSEEMIVSMFGIIKSGSYYVPILPKEENTRVSYILKDSNAKIIITNSNYIDKINALIFALKLNVKVLNIDNILKELNNKPINSNTKFKKIDKKFIYINNQKDLNNENDILYMIYTSGSTGNPKGTKVMHKNVCSLIDSMKMDSVLKPTKKDVSMSLLKYSFDASGIDIYSSLLIGGSLLLVDKENELDPNQVIKLMEKYKVTRSFLIPKWVEKISDEDEKQKANLNSLRILGTGGETLKPNTVEKLHKKYPLLNIINLYGPTETTMFTTYKILGENEFKNNNVNIGKPIKGSRILVVNEFDNVLPINTKGELAIMEDKTSIRNIAKGYNNLEEITKNKFKYIKNQINNENVHIYKTGDYVKINNNLNIDYLGRKDDMVKINGSYLIALNEVENIIYKLLNQKYKVCVVAPQFNNTKVLVCFIENIKDNNELESIKKYINKNITFYMKPKKIVSIEKFPTNNSGKTNRKELTINAEKLLQEKDNKEMILPKNKIEQNIYNIIESYTKLDNISIKDDFINDLGIDSLMLASIFDELNKYEIKMQDLYTYSTIESLAEFIESKKDKQKEKIDYNLKRNNNKKIEINQKNFEDVKIENNSKKFDLSVVLLTGATGFLGIHILKELLENKEVKKIDLLIRDKEFKTAQERFIEKIKYYFPNDKKIEKQILKKVEIINGNTTKEHFNLDDKEYDKLRNEVTTIINSAANVRHYGKEENLINDNVKSIEILLDFMHSNEKEISIAHISTLSILGFKTNETKDVIYDENCFYINQSLNNNPYLISKFLAEKLLLQENNNNVNVKIFRLGNIMPRISDRKIPNKLYTKCFFKCY